MHPLIAALKIIPWVDVINAAPALVKGARKMFARTEADARAAADAVVIDSNAEPLERIHALEQRVLDLTQQRQSTAELIEALAEQNAAVVAEVAMLRARQRKLVWAAGVGVVAGLWALALSYGIFGGG